MDDCLFCKIAAGKIPAKVVYEDDRILAFDDIRPQAPVHTLIIHRTHYASLNEVPEGEGPLLAHVLLKARDSGQEVFHIHFHVLGGRRMAWPPG